MRPHNVNSAESPIIIAEMTPLCIWTNYKPLGFDAALLREKIPQHRIIVGTGSAPDSSLGQADIAFGHPDPQLVIDQKNLRWVHLNTAGYTRYDRDDVRAALKARNGILTSSSAVYSEPCAQHALAMLLSMARRLPHSLHNQSTSRAWPMNQIRADSVLLNRQIILLVGFGSIARRLAELLAPLGMEVIGFRRTIRGDEGIHMLKLSELDSMLPKADHVFNILPSAPATTQFFDADKFRKMKPSAIFYNIGRGDTVDQVAMRIALETRSIAAAFLDVTSPEPLPCDDALWTTPNCYITPHSAGGHANETERLVEHFAENLHRFENKEPLRDRII